MKTCKICNGSMEGKKASAMYCSRKCNTDAHAIKKAKQLGGIPGGNDITLPTTMANIDIATQYVIDKQREDNHKLEQEIIDLKADKREYKNKWETVKEDFKTFQFSSEKDEIKRNYEKPSGLSGVAEQAAPLVQALGITGDHLLRLIEMFPGLKNIGQGALSEAQNQHSNEIIKWLAQLDPEFSEQILKLLTPISTTAATDREAALLQITTLLNTINDGTTNTESENEDQYHEI